MSALLQNRNNVIVNDFFIFYKFPLPSTLSLPHPFCSTIAPTSLHKPSLNLMEKRVITQHSFPLRHGWGICGPRDKSGTREHLKWPASEFSLSNLE